MFVLPFQYSYLYFFLLLYCLELPEWFLIIDMKIGIFVPFLKISELASSRFQKSKYHSFSHLLSFFFLLRMSIKSLSNSCLASDEVSYMFSPLNRRWQVILADILRLPYKNYVYFVMYSVIKYFKLMTELNCSMAFDRTC